MTKEELIRYHRQMILPEIGRAGQEKIKQAKVLVVGAGGLGCPVLLYLAAAGVGTIGIVDGDKVEKSNLQRQILYQDEDIGKFKAEVSAQKIKKQNPFLQVRFRVEHLNPANAVEIISQYDLVVDGTDNFPSRYLINDACMQLNKPFVFGSILRFQGQVSVFNYKDSASYRCLYPDPPAEDESPNCSEIGVLATLPGIVATLQANEVLKIITGVGETLSGKLLVIDLLTLQFETFRFSKGMKGSPPLAAESLNFQK